MLKISRTCKVWAAAGSGSALLLMAALAVAGQGVGMAQKTHDSSSYRVLGFDKNHKGYPLDSGSPN